MSCLQLRRGKMKLQTERQPCVWTYSWTLGLGFDLSDPAVQRQEFCSKLVFCCHQVAPRCPRSPSPSMGLRNQNVHLCNFLSSSHEVNWGKKRDPYKMKTPPKPAPGCLSCLHKRGHLWHFLVSQDGVPPHNETIINHTKQRSSVKGHKNPLNLNSGLAVLQTRWSNPSLSNWCWKQMGFKGKRVIFTLLQSYYIRNKK